MIGVEFPEHSTTAIQHTIWKKLKINREVIAEEFEIGKHISKLEAFYFQMINK